MATTLIEKLEHCVPEEMEIVCLGKGPLPVGTESFIGVAVFDETTDEMAEQQLRTSIRCQHKLYGNSRAVYFRIQRKEAKKH